MRLTQAIAKTYLVCSGILGTAIMLIFSTLGVSLATDGDGFGLVVGGFVIAMCLMGAWMIWARILVAIRHGR
jgi:hypothetical protein